jgi:hypothetical protein
MPPATIQRGNPLEEMEPETQHLNVRLKLETQIAFTLQADMARKMIVRKIVA